MFRGERTRGDDQFAHRHVRARSPRNMQATDDRAYTDMQAAEERASRGDARGCAQM